MQGEPACLRMMRPAREKKRRRRVLVVAIGSPNPMRVVQQARLWAMSPYRVLGRQFTTKRDHQKLA